MCKRCWIEDFLSSPLLPRLSYDFSPHMHPDPLTIRQQGVGVGGGGGGREWVGGQKERGLKRERRVGK